MESIRQRTLRTVLSASAHSDQERILESEIQRFVRFNWDVIVDLARGRRLWVYRQPRRLKSTPSNPLTFQRPNVVHDVPHVRIADAGFTVQSFHRTPDTHTVANINEDFTICRAVVPLVIG